MTVEFGPTPAYLFDAGAARAAARAWLRALGEAPGSRLFYPYKCNRHPALLELFREEGIGAEVNTALDLSRAGQLGHSGEKLILQGPAKSPGMIDATLAAGGFFSADGAEDLEAILGRSRTLGRAPRYLLRLKTSGSGETQKPFGLAAAEVVAFARRIVRRRDPPPSGLSFHLGTGLPGLAPYRSSLKEAGTVARELCGIGIKMNWIDVGGGFSVASESRRDNRGRPRRSAWLDPQKIVADLFLLSQKHLGKDFRLCLEPGRALASDAFHLATRVIRVKKDGKRYLVFVDASRMSHAYFVSRGLHEIEFLRARRARCVPVQIAGTLGTSLDVLVEEARLPLPRPGEVLLVRSVGAYNQIMANAWAAEPPPVVEI
jgi:diaminopimelate decarboxylase